MITNEERWFMAVNQVKSLTSLLGGEFSDIYVKNSSGKETRKFTIEFTEEQLDE